jgi:hypothetical protein
VRLAAFNKATWVRALVFVPEVAKSHAANKLNASFGAGFQLLT